MHREHTGHRQDHFPLYENPVLGAGILVVDAVLVLTHVVEVGNPIVDTVGVLGVGSLISGVIQVLKR